MNKLFRLFVFSFLILCIAAPSVLSWAKDSSGRYLVVLDPGHGGIDKGVRISGDVHESDITLAVAQFIREDLEKAGIAARMTRTGDGASLTDRIQIANDKSTDLFLSIHVNAGFDKEAAGYEIYFPGFSAPPGSENDSKDIVKDMVKTQNLNESVRLARIVQKNLEPVLPRKDRGLREAPIRVQAGIPALSIEIGFATNPAEKKQITSRDVQRKIASALTRSIQQFKSTGNKNAP
jgi:N-acetylmuramoyl-L-alanine amidase